MKKRIIQLLAGYNRADAISEVARNMRRVFRRWGYSSDIVCEATHTLTELSEDARTLEQYREEASAEDLVILHLSMGSSANEAFKRLPGRKAIFYHNVTPAHFFEGLEQTRQLEEGRKQVESLAGTTEVNVAVSEFNASELREMGYKNVNVLPLLLNLDHCRRPIDRATLKEYDDGCVNIVFVGRCVPNKRIEDLLATFYYFQNYVEPQSRLIHAGSFAGMEQYHAMLLAFAHDLALERAEMIGSISQARLNAVYQTADVFLSMSEHEGFCIPVLESMVHDVPVLAYEAAAVPETLDGAGVLFREKRFDVVAEMLGELVRNTSLRNAVVNEQRDRLTRYEQRDLAGELAVLLKPLL